MRVLVVDDSAVARQVIREELSGGGYEVVEAHNGIDALEKAQDCVPDLVTLDVNMPDLDGFATCSRLRQRESAGDAEAGSMSVPVVFLTAHDSDEDRERGFAVGATEFITKLFAQGALLAAVDNILRPAALLQHTTVLVVEDSVMVRRMVAGALRKRGVKVLEAGDGRAGLEMARIHGREIDLIVSDYVMEPMDGAELCRKIRTELGLRDTPVIILSGLAEKKFILKMFEVGASDYVIKPFALAEFMARVQVHMQARYYNLELQKQVVKLESLSKLKDEFLAVTSHDLRSPLTSIQGYAKLILNGLCDAEEQKRFLKRINAASDYLLALINDLLDLGRIESAQEELELNPISVIDVARSSIATLNYMAMPKDIALRLDGEQDEALIIQGSQNSLIRIMNNLISNAIKFTPSGGDVRVVAGRDSKGLVTLSVIDSGIGIPSEQIPYLFDVYSKSSQDGTAGEKGTGLGMAITKKLVEKHNGTISVHSVVGKGTWFKLAFPPAPAA